MKTIGSLLLAMALFIGCKKSDSPPSIAAGMRAKVDGTMVNTNVAYAIRQSGGGGEGVLIFGMNATTGEEFRVVVAKLGTVAAGTYTTGMTGASVEGAAVSYGTASDDWDTQNVVNVTITQINATTVQGTFSGVAEPASGAGANKAITEGSFNVNFQ